MALTLKCSSHDKLVTLSSYEHLGVWLCLLHPKMRNKDPRLYPKMQLKGPRNINKLIHRPEEVLDIQFELIFINAMVHLSQE